MTPPAHSQPARATARGATRRDQRADARRNAAAILDAAQTCLTLDPDATIGEIAQSAGVGRVTLYGHFKARAELVDAVFARVSAQANEVLDATDTSGDPVEALTRLITATWQVVHQLRAVLHTAQRELPAESIRAHHDRHLRRLDALLTRGQRTGVFRRDLPRRWLVTTYYSVVHAAADDCAAGRLDPADADRVIAATLLAAFTAPGQTVPAAPLPERPAS